MKRALYLLTGAIFGAAVWAAPVISLTPMGGAVSGSPGSIVGWGFSIHNPTDFLVVAATDFCVSANQPSDLPCASQVQSLGSYTDFSSADFFVVGPSPYSKTVTQNFDPNGPFGPTGFGSFAINGNAMAGTVFNGEIAIIYDLFAGDPATGGAQIGGDNFISLPASVTVIAPSGVPEPGTPLSFGLGMAGLILFRRRILKS